jgi:hypothetical protein
MQPAVRLAISQERGTETIEILPLENRSGWRELPRPGPVFLTGDIGRGLSRWFRGEVSFGLKEAILHFGVASRRNLGNQPRREGYWP